MIMDLDKIDEIKKAAFARWEAEAAAESERRRQEGKIAIWLERAEDDAPTFTREGQNELHSIVHMLRDERELEAPFLAVDAADAISGYTGQLIITAALIAAPVLKDALVAWIKGRATRKVRVEFHPNGKLKRVEAQTEEQVLEVIEAIRHEAEPSVSKKKTK